MTGIVIPDGGNIGSASDTDAIAISSGGNVTLSQTLDGGAIGSAVTMSANQACVKTALNATGSAPIYACRAWVNFDGSASMTVGQSYGPSTTPNPIRGSGNVSSITDNGGGQYTVNFTTAMSDVNYVVTGMHSIDHQYGNVMSLASSTLAVGSVKIKAIYHYSSYGYSDNSEITIGIFR